MILKEFLKNLNDLANENPKMLDYQVIISKDDEGNEYKKVQCKSSLGIYENNEFISEFEIEDYERKESEINAICINN